MMDSEVVTTRIDVVLKSENTKYTILSVLKRHFLFKQLHDYELEDVIDSMQSRYATAGEIIIRQGDSGDMFYVLEEGTTEQETAFFDDYCAAVKIRLLFHHGKW
jgi:CRP-like cAMP-binding protein